MQIAPPIAPLSLRQRAEIRLLEHGTAAEAWVVLAVARLCVRFCFRRVAGWALQTRPADAPVPHRHLEARLSRSMLRARRLLPGTSLCLPQAMAAKWMLARRGFRSTIHLGVGFRGEGQAGLSPEQSRSLHAHAWLEAGGAVITGASEIATVTPIPRGDPQSERRNDLQINLRNGRRRERGHDPGDNVREEQADALPFR